LFPTRSGRGLSLPPLLFGGLARGVSNIARGLLLGFQSRVTFRLLGRHQSRKLGFFLLNLCSALSFPRRLFGHFSFARFPNGFAFGRASKARRVNGFASRLVLGDYRIVWSRCSFEPCQCPLFCFSSVTQALLKVVIPVAAHDLSVASPVRTSSFVRTIMRECGRSGSYRADRVIEKYEAGAKMFARS